jgi:hypothetical protein
MSIDSVRCWIPVKPTSRLITELRASCGSVLVGPTTNEKADGKWGFRWKGVVYRSRLILHQPSMLTLEMLTRLPKCFLNAVDIAIDLCTASEKAGRLLLEYLRTRLFQSWDRLNEDTKPEQFCDGFYFDEARKSGVNVVTYLRAGNVWDGKAHFLADGLSRGVRIEVQFEGRRALRGIDVVNPVDLVRPEPLLACLRRHLRLGEFDLEQIGRQFCRTPRAKRNAAYHRKIGYLVVRRFVREFEGFPPPVHHLRRCLRERARYRLGSAIRELETPKSWLCTPFFRLPTRDIHGAKPHFPRHFGTNPRGF